jgi:hypothetical protein
MPSFFSLVTLGLILLGWLVVSMLTSYFLYVQNYSQELATSWVFMGNLTSSSISLWLRNAEWNESGDDSIHQLQVFSKIGNDIVFAQDIPAINEKSSFVQSVDVTGLEKSTEYLYKFSNSESRQVLQEGTFRTAPAQGESFRFAASSCSWTGSNHHIYSNILDRTTNEQGLLFMILLGDLHYEDLNTPSLQTRIKAIDRTLGASNQQNLFANLPLSYMWDDHDFLGNNLGGIDSDKAGVEAAFDQYRMAMPHYSLHSNVSMHQSFTISNRVRFVISDLRSELGKSQAISEEQEDWLLNEFAQSDKYDFVIWATSVPWIGVIDDDAGKDELIDAWWGHTEQRERISNFISNQAPKRNIMAISGDAHMLALDDGSNTYYGNVTSSFNSSRTSFPILQTGPLSRIGSIKGGPFSEGCHANTFESNHQYSVIEYDNDNGEPCLTITAYQISSASGKENPVLVKKFCGPDIFARPSTGLDASCEETYFSDLVLVLLGLEIALVLVALGLLMTRKTFGGLSCSGGWLDRVLVIAAFLVWLLLLYGFGITMPFLVAGANVFDMFSVSLVGLLAMLTVVSFLVAWLVYGEPQDGDDASEPEDSNEGVEGQNEDNG